MKKIASGLLTALVWASVVAGVFWVWDWKLIAAPYVFYPALIGLIIFSAVFSAAETAFTILQEDLQSVKENRKKTGLEQPSKLEAWFNAQNTAARHVTYRYRLMRNNIEGEGFLTLLPFLLVMNNLINLSGMYLIGRGLIGGPAAERLSFVISAVIVVIFGEVAAKFVAFKLSAATASWTILIIAHIKPIASWYTSRLVSPIEAILEYLLNR